MIASISSPQQRIDALRGVLRACAISPRLIPCPGIAPNSPFGGVR